MKFQHFLPETPGAFSSLLLALRMQMHNLHAVSQPLHSLNTLQKQSKPIFTCRKAEPHFPSPPSLLSPPEASRAPLATPSPVLLCPAPRVPALRPSLPVWGGLFPPGFVSFEHTPCLCCSFSAAQCASPFPRPGLARASDLGGAKSQGSRVTRGHRGQTKSLLRLM